MGAPLEMVIAGAGGSGLKVVQILEDLGMEPVGFIDDDPDLWGTDFFGYPVLGGPGVVKGRRVGAVCPIGDPANRKRMVDRLRAYDVEFPSVVHPSAQVSSRARVGQGNVFSQNVVVQPGVVIGDFNTLNIGAIMGPLAAVGDFCTVNAIVMIASGAVVNDFCYIGMGAKILQRTVLATGTVVGANAFVNEASEPWTTIVGLPARTVKRNASELL